MLLSLSAWLAIANGESESSAVGRESPPYMVREMWGRDERRLCLVSKYFLSLCMWEEGSESNDLPTDESCMMSMSTLMLMLMLVQLEVAGNRGSPQKHTDKKSKSGRQLEP